MAKISLKSSYKISRRKPASPSWSAARAARSDLAGWIRNQGGIACANRQTLGSTAESLLLYGMVQSTARNLQRIQKRLAVLQHRFRAFHNKIVLPH